jgi:hypothetical protein
MLVRQGLIFRPRGRTLRDYLAGRDPVLGWPGTIAATQRARLQRLAAGPGVSRILEPRRVCAVFGDSFTWGVVRSRRRSYPNVLAQQLGCRVRQLRRGGLRHRSGSCLRYERLAPKRSGRARPLRGQRHRNVNQERAFLTNEPFGSSRASCSRRRRPECASFPCRVPRPTTTPTSTSGARRCSPTTTSARGTRRRGSRAFPFVVSALRVLRHFRVRAALDRRPSYGRSTTRPPLARAGHHRGDHGALRGHRARPRPTPARGLLIPDARISSACGREGRWATSRSWTAGGRPSCVPLGRRAARRRSLATRAPCRSTHLPGGHFQPEGYRALGEAWRALFAESVANLLHALSVRRYREGYARSGSSRARAPVSFTCGNGLGARAASVLESTALRLEVTPDLPVQVIEKDGQPCSCSSTGRRSSSIRQHRRRPRWREERPDAAVDGRWTPSAGARMPSMAGAVDAADAERRRPRDAPPMRRRPGVLRRATGERDRCHGTTLEATLELMNSPDRGARSSPSRAAGAGGEGDREGPPARSVVVELADQQERTTASGSTVDGASRQPRQRSRLPRHRPQPAPTT